MADTYVAPATSQSPRSGDGRPRKFAVEVRGLQHHYGEGELRKQVLFDNNISIAAGEIVIMTGPSGSGKTTLLTLIGTLRTAQEGSLKVLGKELLGTSAGQLVALRRELGFIFQAHNLFESLSAIQNVRMAMELFDLSQQEMKNRATEMLTRLGLGHRINYKPDSLSGGQKQRVAIARGLVHKPKLILADEPTAALDEHSGREVVNLFQQLAKQEGCTVLMVTHDNRILDVADRIVNMVDGRIKSDVNVQESSVICEFLQKCPVFSGLTPRTLTEVADKMLPEEYTPGQTVIRQGDVGDKFYLIRQGAVDVIVEDDKGKRVVATLGEGNFFGEAALLTGNPRNASVVTKADTVLYALGKDDFNAVLAASATFEDELRKALFERQ
jgi:putative ABC transport system ATP-binding protein